MAFQGLYAFVQDMHLSASYFLGVDGCTKRFGFTNGAHTPFTQPLRMISSLRIINGNALFCLKICVFTFNWRATVGMVRGRSGRRSGRVEGIRALLRLCISMLQELGQKPGAASHIYQ
ncbi:MAG TPA: hypothetical protein DCP91_03250 [Eggerthellaceae bacterium]|nr:hypothetical protein [Eggerthellaceae bacterium]